MPQDNFSKILIANRGEIAVRVMRTCREMGIKTVAVYSDADRTAPHVLMADEAYNIGKAPARDSYLRQDVIIETALKCRAQAIHPGYGFLSENADFAQAVKNAGLIFIGPHAEAIQSMGSKTAARQLMTNHNVPVVPGTLIGNNPNEALVSAQKIGFPVLVKAAMGGGGKGMRVVFSGNKLLDALAAARRESESAFGSDEVYLEKYIEGPRHIEVQILADEHGNCIHLYERECSIQRRHQKVIEEAPAPGLDAHPELREKIGQAAVAAAKACGYVNAGTVEFLYNPVTAEFYFLEMNTRLQVEHPVTEFVTGIDLVRQQILIAQGERLTLKQDQVRHRGHSIECRIYAEDPDTGFLPDAGTISHLIRPDGPWVRVDSGVNIGSEVGVYYDPLVAKLIVWGANRNEAITRMKRALQEYRVLGFATIIPFLRRVMDHPRFIQGDFDTRFIDQEFSSKPTLEFTEEQTITAAASAVIQAHFNTKKHSVHQTKTSLNSKPQSSTWKQAGRLRLMR